MTGAKMVLSAGKSELAAKMEALVIGQPQAIEAIVPFVQMHQAGLSPAGRPIGSLMLLGPTGNGKTHTVESLAEALHGSRKNVLRIDCGEFQLDHEVAKLIGAPPGYLGHRETQPMINQGKVNGVCSDNSDVSLILFDEIEKAAPSMTRILLGLLDKATLHLGDNTSVNFERCLIFFTSNLGERAIQQRFDMVVGESLAQTATMSAVRRHFSPEFINRIDAFLVYNPLTREQCRVILSIIIDDFSALIVSRLGWRSFFVEVTSAARERLLDIGCNDRFGARGLKRAVDLKLNQPLAALISEGAIAAGKTVTLDYVGEFIVELR